MEVQMGNYLMMADKQRILALIELGWSYRRIQRETGVHRDTVARYDPRREPKPAKVTAGSTSKPAGVTPGSISACEPYRDYIDKALDKGLTAQRIWQDLREEYGFGYSSSDPPPKRLPITKLVPRAFSFLAPEADTPVSCVA
jgi:IS30 family transposase